MKVIVGGRASGKTTEAIKLANETDSYLLVPTKNMASETYHSETLPDLDRFPISYGEVSRMRGRGDYPVVVDNLDMIVQNWFDFPIKAVTMTVSDVVCLGGDDE